MPLTLADLVSDVGHALPDGVSGSLIGGAEQVVNEAGRALYAAHPWRFRQRPSALLDFTEDQTFVALPNDFGEVQSYVANSLISQFNFTTLQQIASMRAKNIMPVGFAWWGAIVHSHASDAYLLPRIELYPTPNATIEDALMLFYLAEWVELADDTDVPRIPSWCESLLRQYVRAFAESYEIRKSIAKTSSAALDAALMAIKEGEVFRSAVRRDGGVQRDIGVVTNGAAERMRFIGPFEGRQVADPFIT